MASAGTANPSSYSTPRPRNRKPPKLPTPDQVLRTWAFVGCHLSKSLCSHEVSGQLGDEQWCLYIVDGSWPSDLPPKTRLVLEAKLRDWYLDGKPEAEAKLLQSHWYAPLQGAMVKRIEAMPFTRWRATEGALPGDDLSSQDPIPDMEAVAAARQRSANQIEATRQRLARESARLRQVGASTA